MVEFANEDLQINSEWHATHRQKRPIIQFPVTYNPYPNRIRAQPESTYDDQHCRLTYKPIGLHHGSSALRHVAVDGPDLAAGIQQTGALDRRPGFCMEWRRVWRIWIGQLGFHAVGPSSFGRGFQFAVFSAC